MADISGTWDARFEPVRDALAEQLERDELGASLVVDLDGTVVVDIWGGWRDLGRQRPWQQDTITNVWSTTKTITNLAALMPVERGQLDVYKPVATYWPEFAAGGKDRVEVRHLLSHNSGVSGWDAPFAVNDMYDW
jgi:CubicO group peptidase (beta-lactamase class C family)